jgi:VIT1/CCC1 family predicted Fe2+/Mn2+ transporter
MIQPSAHPEEIHFINRTGWIRAAVLGANDGIVSVSSLIVGVAAANPGPKAIVIAGAAGLVAGAMSMAAGEYVSVSSQADIERADIEREKIALKEHPEVEQAELAAIYEERGLTKETAQLVANELTQNDALGAHIRDELGMSEIHSANPLQAALASGFTFSVSAALPLAGVFLAPAGNVIPTVLGITVFALFLLGYLGAKAGGAPVFPSILRVVLWGVFAMAITAAVGALFGVSV